MIKNSFWLGAIEAVSKVFMFVVTVSLVRYWGADEFGAYNLGFAYVAVFMILADFGLSTITTREVAKYKELTEKYLGNLLGLKLVLSLGICLLLSASFWVVNRPVATELLVMILIYNLLQSFQSVYIAIFQAWEKMEMVFLNKVVYYIGILLMALTVISFRGNAINLVSGYALVSGLSMGLGMWQISRMGIRVKLAVDLEFWKKLLIEALPLLGMAVATTIYINNDTLLIGRYLGNDQVGFYQTAYKILFAFQSINVINYAIFPRMTVLLHQNNIKTAKKLVLTVVGWSLLGLIPLAGLITVERKLIMEIIYGSSFGVAAEVMSLLVWAGVIGYFRILVMNILLAQGKQKKVLYAVLGGLLINITINYLLIPKLGFNIAGLSLIISETVILGLMMGFLRK